MTKALTTAIELMKLANQLPPLELFTIFAGILKDPYIQPEADIEWSSQVKIPHNIVMITAGVDSTIAYARAKLEGKHPQGLYIDLGQSYAGAERYSLNSMKIPFIEIDMREANIENRDHRWEYVIPGRNLALILAAAEQAGWGMEVWFSAVGGEIPPDGNDKSEFFIHSMEKLLQKYYNVTLITQAERNKSEWVKWWLDQGLSAETLCQTYSCFQGIVGKQCGHCKGCWKRYYAFASQGIPDEQVLWNYLEHPLAGMREYTSKTYDKALYELEHPGYWGRARCEETIKFLGERKTIWEGN